MNIYIGNLSLDVTEEELRREFMAYGEVASVTMMNDKYIGSGQPRGYCYVEMTSRAAGVVAITKLSGKKLKDRPMHVLEALPLSDKKHADAAAARAKVRSTKSRRRYYQPA
ncbi:MAG: hypothetical protein A2Y92_00195 [Chloroflexi bacterium RBG_13_57_8]|nr:MAG: hypothetical protein A2Y92_00195 [Chloroflexi bacterium RBG_13_57_8]